MRFRFLQSGEATEIDPEERSDKRIARPNEKRQGADDLTLFTEEHFDAAFFDDASDDLISEVGGGGHIGAVSKSHGPNVLRRMLLMKRRIQFRSKSEKCVGTGDADETAHDAHAKELRSVTHDRSKALHE